MNWTQFKESAPDLAKLAEERFQRHGLVLVGTLRRNGWPRISPVEPLIVEGVLYLGMTWRSQKALDLLRDPRITVQTHRQQQRWHRGGSQVVRARRGCAVCERPVARTWKPCAGRWGTSCRTGRSSTCSRWISSRRRMW